MARRLAEGKTKKEVMRCLKRYVVREISATIQRGVGAANQPLTA